MCKLTVATRQRKIKTRKEKEKRRNKRKGRKSRKNSDWWNSDVGFLEPNGSNHKTSTLYHKMPRAQLVTTM